MGRLDYNRLTGGTITVDSILLKPGGEIIHGDGLTEGDWKIVRVGNNWERHRLESSTWVRKGAWTV